MEIGLVLRQHLTERSKLKGIGAGVGRCACSSTPGADQRQHHHQYRMSRRLDNGRHTGTEQLEARSVRVFRPSYPKALHPNRFR